MATTTTNINGPSERNNLQKLFTKLASLFVQKFATLSQKFQLFTQKFRIVAVTSALSLLLGIMTFFPQSASASAGLFSAKDTASTTLSVGMGGGGGKSGGTAKRVGKFVVTIGAIGAGATTANVLRNKFTSCSDDNDDEEEESSAASPHKNEPKNEAMKNESKTKGTTTNDDKSEIQPLSAEWIQQQLSDVERRSNVVNDAIKMTQQSSSSQPPPTAPPSASGGVNNKNGGTSKIVTNGGSSTTKTPTKKQQLSVGNTIGIPNNTKNPLVKNLDSKIEMLQRRDAERTSQAQRFHDEQMKVKEEQKKVAIVEAERKIDLAEKEYKKKSQQQQQVQQVVETQVVEEQQEDVEEEESTITTTSSSSSQRPISSKVFGPGGQPAKSKEEDLELTTQVILEYVKSMESSSGGGGGVDDSGDDDE